VPASGFYEWQKLLDRKQPYFFAMRDGKPFAFAGLWDRWSGESGEVVESCSIVTTRPNEVTRAIHDRMPVIVESRDHDAWLAPRSLSASLRETLLRPFPAERMTGHPVSTSVSKPGNEGPGLVEPVGPALDVSLELELDLEG
jgi:putative SOS response-associated peptidase YedK